MAGYSGTPLWKKLGYQSGTLACVEGAFAGYRAALDLPPGISVNWAGRAGDGIDLAHLFTTSKLVLKARLKLFRKGIDPDGMIWVSWPKKSSGVTTDVTEEVIREAALPLGLVDIKVCAVNEVWSGLKLVIRKELRSTGPVSKRNRKSTGVNSYEQQ
jgi:hypothetical protein